eukprot:771080-Rhodomonas_salina.5
MKCDWAGSIPLYVLLICSAMFGTDAVLSASRQSEKIKQGLVKAEERSTERTCGAAISPVFLRIRHAMSGSDTRYRPGRKSTWVSAKSMLRRGQIAMASLESQV